MSFRWDTDATANDMDSIGDHGNGIRFWFCQTEGEWCALLMGDVPSIFCKGDEGSDVFVALDSASNSRRGGLRMNGTRFAENVYIGNRSIISNQWYRTRP